MNLKTIIVAIVLSIVAGLIVYYSGYHKGLKDTKIETRTVTVIDTVLQKVHVVVDKPTIDTVYLTIPGDSTLHIYEQASLDTTIASDSSTVRLAITYDEFYNRFGINAEIFSYNRTTLITKTILQEKERFAYGLIGVSKNNGKLCANTSCGLIIAKHYLIGIYCNTNGYLGIQAGGLF